ncbi:MAG: septum formation initiator family protein [Acidobacteriota bacterium]
MNRKTSENKRSSASFGKRSFSIRGAYVVQSLIVVLMGLNILLLYGLFVSSQGILGYHQQCRQVDDLMEKTTRIKRENHKLFKKIQAFKADTMAQERFVRQQLGWVRENELMVEFITPQDSPEPKPKPSVSTPPQTEAPPRTPERPQAQPERKPGAPHRQPIPKKP